MEFTRLELSVLLSSLEALEKQELADLALRETQLEAQPEDETLQAIHKIDLEELDAIKTARDKLTSRDVDWVRITRFLDEEKSH